MHMTQPCSVLSTMAWQTLVIFLLLFDSFRYIFKKREFQPPLSILQTGQTYCITLFRIIRLPISCLAYPEQFLAQVVPIEKCREFQPVLPIPPSKETNEMGEIMSGRKVSASSSKSPPKLGIPSTYPSASVPSVSACSVHPPHISISLLFKIKMTRGDKR